MGGAVFKTMLSDALPHSVLYNFNNGIAKVLKVLHWKVWKVKLNKQSCAVQSKVVIDSLT